MTKPIITGVIGAGNIGNVHMQGLKALPEQFELRAVQDVYKPLAELRAGEYEIEHVYETAEELIADEQLDAVIIAVPNKYHAPLAIQALQAGKHVILEKPMALHVEAAREIVRAQKESGKCLLVPHQMRWEWTAQEVSRQVQAGALGQIYHAKAGWFRRKGIPGWGTWFTRKEESGGGPLIDIGVHMLDLSLYLMGNPKPVSVTGTTFAEFGPKKKGIGSWGKPNWQGLYDVEDLASAFIRMEDGRSLTLEVSWAVHADIENGGPFVHLMGSEGGASLRGNQGKLFTEHFDQAMEVELKAPVATEPRKQMMLEFAACIEQGTQPISNVMTGFTNNLILDAIFRSSEQNKEIELDYSL